MTPSHFSAIFQELLDENPFAVRATLRIVDVEFTEKVTTLAVTCEERPRLLVNLGFIATNCKTETHVKALLCHEFLHVLLRHTERKAHITRARHIATDAVINAIIHRTLGADYSSMMATYYAKATGIQRLLREPLGWEAREDIALTMSDPTRAHARFLEIWLALYEGKLNVDDIEEVSDEIIKNAGPGEGDDFITILLGNHDDLAPLPEELVKALNRSLLEMNGHGIWRSPRDHGVGANPYEALIRGSDEPTRAWERTTLRVLREHVRPDRKSRAFTQEEANYRIPVLSSKDRRAFLGALWLPYLPEADWAGSKPLPSVTTQLYLAK